MGSWAWIYCTGVRRGAHVNCLNLPPHRVMATHNLELLRQFLKTAIEFHRHGIRHILQPLVDAPTFERPVPLQGVPGEPGERHRCQENRHHEHRRQLPGPAKPLAK